MIYLAKNRCDVGIPYRMQECFDEVSLTPKNMKLSIKLGFDEWGAGTEFLVYCVSVCYHDNVYVVVMLVHLILNVIVSFTKI